MEYTIEQKNNGIIAFLGGPSAIRPLFSGLMDEEFHLIGPQDLKFHRSWNWMMLVWKKLRKELMATQADGSMLFALSKALDDVDIEAFHRITATYCVEWCKRKNIKL